MNISDALKPFTAFLSLEVLMKAVELPISFFPDQVNSVIPAIVLGSDGPFLRSLFLIGKQHLCEVQVSGANALFDYMTLGSAHNYRVEFGTHTAQVSETSSITYRTVTITLAHTGGIASSITYVGDDPTEWITAVRKALPISILSD